MDLIRRVMGLISTWFLLSDDDDPNYCSSASLLLFPSAIPLTAYGPMAAAAAAAVVRGKSWACVCVCAREREEYSLCSWLHEVDCVFYLDS